MRPLTSDELKLVLERGVRSLVGWSTAEVVQALALEVSERRAEEGASGTANLREAICVLREAERAFTELERWSDRRGAPIRYREKVVNMMANAPAEVDVFLTRAAEAGIGEGDVGD